MTFFCEIGQDSGVQKDTAEAKRTMSSDKEVSIEVPRNTPLDHG